MASATSTLCPSLEDLEQFVAGENPLDSIGAHVAVCERCRREMDRLCENNRLLAEFASASHGMPIALADRLVDLIPGYELLDEIHRGGQGVVYRAIQKSTRRVVAIKIMHGGPISGARERARFDREVHILAALQHPNIVAIHDSGNVGSA